MPSSATITESLVGIYKCFSDLNRLRILSLLKTGSQCVCHIEGVLGIGAVRTSQQLGYLRRHGLVEVEVCGTWRKYSLPAKPGPELAANLVCLEECTSESPVFRKDLRRLEKIRREVCGPKSK